MNNKPATTELINKEDAVHYDTVRMKGLAIIQCTGALALKFLDLCLTIRKSKIAPRVVTTALKTLGFKASRISEINRVANAPDKIFSAYEAKMIGFDRSLALTRLAGTDKRLVPTPAGDLLLEENVVTGKELESQSPETPVKREKVSLRHKLKSHAETIASLSTKDEEWDFTAQFGAIVTVKHTK